MVALQHPLELLGHHHFRGPPAGAWTPGCAGLLPGTASALPPSGPQPGAGTSERPAGSCVSLPTLHARGRFGRKASALFVWLVKSG